MITLYSLPPGLGLPVSASPFCVKADLLLRMAAVPYDIRYLPDPGKGPLGKLPYIRDEGAEPPRDLPDSSLICRHLQQYHNFDAWPGLDGRDRAAAHALAVMMEERLYWVIVYERWMEDGNWDVVRRAYFAPVPGVLRGIVAAAARRNTHRNLDGHGLGRHERSTVLDFGRADLDAVSAWLGGRAFMMGDEPCALDATAFAMLSAISDATLETAMKSHLLQLDNLRTYLERMRVRFYDGAGG